MATAKPLRAATQAVSSLLLPKTDLFPRLSSENIHVDTAQSCVKIDVRGLSRGLYYFSLRFVSDHVPLGPRLTAARPHFETSDHIFTFVNREQTEFFGTVLIIDDIEYLHFYPSKLPCELSITACGVRQINAFARDYIFGETFVRLKIFGPRWTWSRSLEELKAWFVRRLRGGVDDSYAGWWKLHGQPGAGYLAAQRARGGSDVDSGKSEGPSGWPRIAVVLQVKGAPLGDIKRSIDSVMAQTLSDWDLVIYGEAFGADEKRHCQQLADEHANVGLHSPGTGEDGPDLLNSVIGASNTAFTGFLHAGDTLCESALFEVLSAAMLNDGAQVLYSDEDTINCQGMPVAGHFKPDWNYDLFLSINYICHFLVVANDHLLGCGGLAGDCAGAEVRDLCLRATESIQPNQILHIPKVLYHRVTDEDSPEQLESFASEDPLAVVKSIENHLQRTGVDAWVSQTEVPGGYRVTYAIPQPPPTVAIIIPTYNNLRVLQNCIEKLLAKTDYPSFEILIVDNRSDDAATLAYLARPVDERIRVLRYQAEFNFSAINNFAVSKTDAQVVLLLNNDTEVCNSDWLTEIVAQVSRPGVGAVGAKLFYAEDRIQHAGVLLGMGPDRVAGHAFKGFHKDEIGALGRTRLVQNYHAVTGACLAVSREHYLEVGGLDEENLAIAFNDVDFCLKLRAAGYRNLWTPYAQLYHYESYSRGYDVTDEKRARFVEERDFMHRKWADALTYDSNYNPNLTRDFDNFSLAWPPSATDMVGDSGS